MKDLKCPCTGINITRFLAMVAAGYIFVLGFEFLVHGNLLMGIYEETAGLWRPEEEMQNYFPLMIAYNIALIATLGFIFTRNFEGKGVGEGLRFGAMVGVLMAILNAAAYIWMPIPLALALGWAGAGLGIGLGLGLIFALIYKAAK